MAGNAVRRPLPALVSLAALLVLTALVWWRVIERDPGAHAQGRACPTPTVATSPALAPTTTLPPPSTVRVLVLNSTSRNGIAGQARTALLKAGFAAPQPAGNYTGKAKITGVGQIRYPRSSKAAATLIGHYLPGATLVAASGTTGPITVVLGPGYHSVLSAAQAGAVLARDRATVSSAPSSTPVAGSPGAPSSASGTTPTPTTASPGC